MLFSNLKNIKPKANYLHKVLIALLFTMLGSTISFQASADNNSSYNNFQSKIDTYIGQDPNLTQADNNPHLSTSMFNVNGPVQISINWSDVYGLILQTHYANLLNDTNAIAIEGNIGAKQNRINVTLGQVFSQKNRIKLTLERLAQKQAFDFYSGSIDEWVSQYAGGVELQHLISTTGFFNNISAGGYYARSDSKSLDPIIYDKGDSEFINYRHIAGAISTGGHVSLGLKPWNTGMITLTSYYDSVRYNAIYSDVSAEDSNSLGYGVSLEQYISYSVKAYAEYSHRTLYNTVQTGFQFFHNIRHNSAAIGMSLGYAHNDYNDTNDTVDGTNSENTYTIGLQYYFMPIKNGYTMPEFNLKSLTAWTSEPAVYMNKVMAASDQVKELITIEWNTNIYTNSEGTRTELISWSNNAHSNVPNESFTYRLRVIPVNKDDDPDYNYDQDVTNTSQAMIPNLKPNIRYKAILKLTENNSKQVRSSEKTFSTTDTGTYTWDPHTTQLKAYEKSVQLQWIAPDRTYVSDAIDYQIKLINENPNSKEEHTYEIERATKPGDPVTYTTPNDLHPSSNYLIKITPSNIHKDVYLISVSPYYCGTAANSIVWDDDPIHFDLISKDDKTNTYVYTLKWDAATLNDSNDSLEYKYSVEAKFTYMSYGQQESYTTTFVNNTTTGLSDPDQIIVRPQDPVHDTIQYVHATVVTKDTQQKYDPVSKTKEGDLG